MGNDSNTTEQTIHLKDGRKLGYHVYGDRNGFPIIALHGTPGSRLWFVNDDPISKSIGVKLITLDRPGYGLSSPKPNRKIIDFNSDINELLDAMKIDQFSIFGVSGGGAFALAYAGSPNPKLHKTGLVASVYEFQNGKVPKDMCRPNRWGFFLANHMPWILRYNYRQQKYLLNNHVDYYKKSIQDNNKHLCLSDQQILKNPDTLEVNIRQLKAAFYDTPYEAVNELQLFSKHWGISVLNIQTPIEIWHGEDDTLSPIAGLRDFVQPLPNKVTHFLNGKGHFLDEDDAIWEAILKSLIH